MIPTAADATLVQPERLIRDFMELVQIPGLPMQEGKVALAVRQRLEALGIAYEIDDAGASAGAQTGNIIARLPGNVAGATPLGFAAHMDVVSDVEGMVPELRDGVVYSDGAHILGSDNRSAVAAVLELARVLLERQLPHGPVELLFTIDEEARMTGVKELDLARLASRYIFAPDSDNPAHLERFGAHYRYALLDFHGRATHSQTPQDGVNAIQMAAEALARLSQGLVAPATTMNFGTIRGGKAENVIPDHVAVVGELRGLDPVVMAAQEDHVRAACDAAAARFGGRADVRFVTDLEGYALARESPIVAMVERAMREVGLAPIDVPTGGNSESNVFNARGVPSISLGTGAYNAHAHNEYTPVADLVAATRLLLALVAQGAVITRT